MDVHHSWSGLLEEAARQMSFIHHFNPLLALSCQPQVLHTVSADCIPVSGDSSEITVLHSIASTLFKISYLKKKKKVLKAQ